MIALVTDSASQIPPTLAERFGVRVVPVIITIDGNDYREGIDLNADDFWARFEGGTSPDVTTSQPSPGDFRAVYEDAIAAGATEIVSVHVAADVSGTINSAHLAADLVTADVHVVDSGTASFGVSSCVWEAAAAIDAGGSAIDAAERAAKMAPNVGTSFIIQALDFARQGGRFDFHLPDDAEGVIVLSGLGTAVEITGRGRSVDELCDQMAAHFTSDGVPVRAGVCLADAATLPFTEGIEERLRASDLVVDMVRYRVGPSIAAHTGPGTAGGFWWPVRD